MKRRADCDKRAHDAANIRKMNIYVKMGDSWVKKAKYILSEASESYIAKLYDVLRIADVANLEAQMFNLK